MASASIALQDFLVRFGQRQLAGPVLILLILAMMVLPLPPFALDLFFTFNIAISVIVMLVAMSVMKPLDFSVFPTVLLVTTLLRLSLNVASTRVVLLEGHTGPAAAGQVIDAFGHFLVGGNYAVGLVVFTILVVINFVVITKGAGRVAEVAARFTLDAMPGKQMAIDADLNAGLIGEDEARKRRATIAEEADFFGSMDGASKFVRGDAIAGILIMLINIVGGLFVGVLQHNLDLATAARSYTLLTIGDGLVAQIPALIISIAAGMVVTRVGDQQDVSQQFLAQLFGNPRLLFLTAGIVGVLGLIPGMPNFVFLLLAGGLGYTAWQMQRRQQAAAPVAVAAVPPTAREVQEASWADVVALDVLGLEVGYRLIPLVDKAQDGELLRRIRGIRKKFAQDVGFLVSPIHIRDNLELKPNAYRIFLKGVQIGEGEVFPGNLLAINPGRVAGDVPGTATRDPAFGLPALWIDPLLREQAQAYGYTVVDPSTVIATHLNHLILSHSAELLGRQETQALLDHLAKDMPKLVEELVPKALPLGAVQKVLRNLLDEGVHLRDMRTVIETLADHAPRVQDPEVLTAQVRIALGRSIVQALYPAGAEMQVMSLDPQLERLLLQAVAGAGDSAAIEPGLADTLIREAVAAAQRQEEAGLPAVLLVPATLRPLLSRFLRRSIVQLRVLAHGEVPEERIIKVTSVIGQRP
ncbi:flagellar biosynthesis protein FlhA [Accumulibacter sp.]|uniref:flagellar biosynthesis protein FlhA n=1 Tax=Accumulibacter sp. TaxID=2053492 RepID=UPI0025CEB6BF|nr:flagellar biosynthesis protein FlhA [Accumulibacter sp.]MCM8596227.1 flagellar biosynthesis protein FlhA [Accumulibacter sp.]MCM8627158.1 flagellar biosynthesis protein FlhA [Accumulibacter sp.]MDS4050376.1 flagellar biosynthesis protein FlhA [Accumulibacter sp.]